MRPAGTETLPAVDDDGQRTDDVKGLVGFQLRRAHTLFALHWQVNFDHEGAAVTPVQGGMLMEIASHPGISQTDLARLMSVEGPTLIQTMDRLESRGLIRRERRTEDRRRYALYLTAAGEEMLAAVRHFIAERDDTLLAGLSADEQRMLLMLLQRVVRRGQAVLDEDLRERVRGSS